uniref:Putative secreted protein n=1 Tax=Ixodes ricinus TaxID=34613 RepID=A0A6B0V8T5_IXORI
MGLGRLKAILLRLVVGVVSQGHLFLIHVVQRVQGFTDVVVASVDVGLRRGRGGSIHDRRHLLLGHRETASLLEELVQLRHAHGLVQVGWHVLQGRALLLNLFLQDVEVLPEDVAHERRRPGEEGLLAQRAHVLALHGEVGHVDALQAELPDRPAQPVGHVHFRPLPRVSGNVERFALFLPTAETCSQGLGHLLVGPRRQGRHLRGQFEGALFGKVRERRHLLHGAQRARTRRQAGLVRDLPLDVLGRDKRTAAAVATHQVTAGRQVKLELDLLGHFVLPGGHALETSLGWKMTRGVVVSVEF